MTRIYGVLLLLLLAFSAKSQKWLNKLKDKVNETIDNVGDENFMENGGLLGQGRAKQLEKDTSNYNYIFSQGNRASFFANRDSKESFLLTAGKNYEDEDGNSVELEIYEKVFDSNRAGERAMYLNTNLARFNFAQALGFLSEEAGSANWMLDSAFSISSFVNVGALTLPERYALGKTIANYAILYHSEGRYNLSSDLLAEAERFFTDEISAGTIALASIYCNLGVVNQSKGNFTKAENYFDEALDKLKAGEKGSSLSYAIALNNKALLFNELGQYPEAKQAIRQAISIAEGELRSKGRDNTSFKINKGLIHYSAGEYALAESLFREIIELKKKRLAENQTDVANVKNYLAATLMAENATSEVVGLLNDALEIFKKKYSEENFAYIKTKHNLGRYYLITEDYAAAERVFSEVNAAYGKLFSQQHPDFLSSLEDLAVVAWKQGNISTAKSRFDQTLASNVELVEKYFGAMSEYEKSQYWSKVRPSLLKFYAFAAENGGDDPQLLADMYNLHLKTKGVLLSASAKVREQILSSTDENLKRTYASWVQTKEDLLLYYSYTKTQLSELKVSIPEIESKANRLEKELNRMSSDFAASNKLPSVTLQDVKASLQANDVAIEVIGFPAYGAGNGEKRYAFLLAKANAAYPECIVLEDGKALDTKYAKAYLNMVKLKSTDRFTYQKFWQPIDERLEGVENVHLSPDGVYFQVNIGAFRKQDGSYVSDNFDIHLYSSTRDLVNRNATKGTGKKATFFGNPAFGNRGVITPLPGTKREIDAVSSITQNAGFSTSTFTQRQATESNFKSISSPGLLHIATHGFFLPESETAGERVFGVDVAEAKDNPLLRAGLMLTDAEQAMQQDQQGTEVNTTNNGILTAYEVITLNLKDTDLVVLSACETGLGEIKSGEGVYGLQRAFQVAGAEAVIMSLWKVSDDATQKLMTSFYRNWMSGMSKEASFFKAQRSLRKAYPEPYYWGAFIMLGS
ncbi:MAG: CHAT domain-containing tetratricopeptide repeat protein [Bacteroidota bacterium]